MISNKMTDEIIFFSDDKYQYKNKDRIVIKLKNLLKQ